MSKLSRRSMLSAAVGLAAATSEAGAPIGLQDCFPRARHDLDGQIDDPIFAAIEAHREAVRSHRGMAQAFDSAPYAEAIVAQRFWPFLLGSSNLEAERERDRLNALVLDALSSILTTEPTTLAGLAALLDHLASPEDNSRDADIVLAVAIECGCGYLDDVLRRMAAMLRRLSAAEPRLDRRLADVVT